MSVMGVGRWEVGKGVAVREARSRGTTNGYPDRVYACPWLGFTNIFNFVYTARNPMR